jgi:hypothetical protein
MTEYARHIFQNPTPHYATAAECRAYLEGLGLTRAEIAENEGWLLYTRNDKWIGIALADAVILLEGRK